MMIHEHTKVMFAFEHLNRSFVSSCTAKHEVATCTFAITHKLKGTVRMLLPDINFNYGYRLARTQLIEKMLDSITPPWFAQPRPSFQPHSPATAPIAANQWLDKNSTMTVARQLKKHHYI